MGLQIDDVLASVEMRQLQQEQERSERGGSVEKAGESALVKYCVNLNSKAKIQQLKMIKTAR